LQAYTLDQLSCSVKLNQNELPYPPVEFMEEMKGHLEAEDFHRYPHESSRPMREILGKELNWPKEGIVVANGSNVLVQGLILACSVQGTVLTVKPSFSIYRQCAQLLANRVVEVPLEADFSLPVEKWLHAIRDSNPNLIFLANPNAPTGNLFSDEAIRKGMQEAKCLFVLDEAYYPYSDKSYVEDLKKFPHLVIMRTFSKSSGLAGMRLGYLVGHPDIMAQVEKVFLPFRVSCIAQKMGIRAVKNRPKELERVQKTRQELSRVFKEMDSLEGIHPYPSQGNFILFRVDHPLGVMKVYKGLCDQNILLRDLSKEESLGPCLRVTIGTPQENEQFLKGLRSVIHG